MAKKKRDKENGQLIETDKPLYSRKAMYGNHALLIAFL